MSLKTTRLLSCICLASWLSGCQVTTTGKNGYNGNWAPLFDGTSLAGWKQSDFLNPGITYARDRKLVIPAGEVLSGITWARDFPKMDYEIRLEAMRADGSDFFCGLTFPVNDSFASLILGGWGGTVCGISCLDGEDAANNETTTSILFKNRAWYAVRLRVTKDKLEAWLDNEKIVNADTKDRQIDVRIEVEESRPLGLATFQTTAALRNVRWRKLVE
ncbi:MAG: DUF1080 domain-containing protein [Planctomycetota bacterium]|nr:hypothetical protein [Planctomycetota bacterium]MEE3053886.1 DUF1080 domain-containing protein [Planctomycetota bacterium]|tara:strand:+ start:870 stop:1520 length:651 start_codon:yes stop_codon:yes gene_type:complete